MLGSPRFQHGYESHGRTSFDFNANGEQIYGRQELWGGSDHWGWRVGYGHRTGNNYRTGDNLEMPSSYKSRDWDVALGYDFSRDSHLEFSYLRLDQTDVEFPGQIFDFDFLATDAFELTWTLENQCYFDSLTVEGWYNHTRFAGNAQRSGKRQQFPVLDQIGFIGDTDAANTSTGGSAFVSWGNPYAP